MRQRPQILIGLFIFCSLLAVGVRFQGRRVNWLWEKWPLAGVALILLTFLVVWLWMDAERKSHREQTDRARREVHTRTRRELLLARLSGREREILELMLLGKTNREIADERCIALSTVKTHVNHIYKALEVSSREEVEALFAGE